MLHTVGIKRDGTVVAVGQNTDNQCNVSSWTNIKQVSAGSFYTEGVKTNGTVVVTTKDNTWNNAWAKNAMSWTKIKQISTSYDHIVGLKEDGTVVAISGDNNKYGQCDVSHWTNIKQVLAGNMYTAALRYDGTVMVTGDLDEAYLSEVSSWNLDD